MRNDSSSPPQSPQYEYDSSSTTRTIMLLLYEVRGTDTAVGLRNSSQYISYVCANVLCERSLWVTSGYAQARRNRTCFTIRLVPGGMRHVGMSYFFIRESVVMYTSKPGMPVQSTGTGSYRVTYVQINKWRVARFFHGFTINY